MKTNIVSKNYSISDSFRKSIESKFIKFEKYFRSETEINISLEVKKNLSIVEATFSVGNTIFRAEESSNDMLTSLDKVIDKISMQITKFKTRLEKKYRNKDTIRFEQIPDYEEDFEDIKIVKTKRFNVKPMSSEEAVLQMEMLNHNFFVFLNDLTDEVNVVYKRKHGQYGLIEATPK